MSFKGARKQRHLLKEDLVCPLREMPSVSFLKRSGSSERALLHAGLMETALVRLSAGPLQAKRTQGAKHAQYKQK